MTKNQIEYLKLRETQRSNRASERLTEQRDQRSYEVASASLDETIRHNVAAEGVQHLSLHETARHNLANEVLTSTAQYETQRANKAKEAETNRANLAAEAERNRAALASEAIARAQLDETSRAHRASESIGYSQVGATFASISETSRANQANEAISLQRVAEEQRHSIAVESETYRHNLRQESQTDTKNFTERLKNAETVRHNQATEKLSAAKIAIEGIGTVSNSVFKALALSGV